MTVFKAFFKVFYKYKAPIIMYTVFLVFFGIFNMQANDHTTMFSPSKPRVLIVNSDVEEGITKHLIQYMETNSEIVDIQQDEDSIRDALFYRDVNYVIYIPNNYRLDFVNGDKPKIEIQSTGDYQSSLANMLLERYLRVAHSYRQISITEEEFLQYMDNTLKSQTEVELTSKLDTAGLEKTSTYYNFTNYCILAGCIYVICLILASFKNERISKRTIISSMNYKEYNRKLLLSNLLFTFILWLFYVILSFLLTWDGMIQVHGVFYILNSFVFTLCAVSIAFLIGSLQIQKEAVNGIVNVIALGSSFLCGAFVPAEFLPDLVLKFAHILPSYWFIQTNELLKEIEVFSIDTISPIFINMLILIGFTLLFILLTNVVSRKRQKIG